MSLWEPFFKPYSNLALEEGAPKLSENWWLQAWTDISRMQSASVVLLEWEGKCDQMMYTRPLKVHTAWTDMLTCLLKEPSYQFPAGRVNENEYAFRGCCHYAQPAKIINQEHTWQGREAQPCNCRYSEDRGRRITSPRTAWAAIERSCLRQLFSVRALMAHMRP